MEKEIENRITIKSSSEIKLEIVVLLYKQGEYYIANCPSLALSSYGDTED